MRDINTAMEANMFSQMALSLNDKKSFDMIMNHIQSEIQKACHRGEFDVKIKISKLEAFVCNSNFYEILNRISIILSGQDLEIVNTNNMMPKSKGSDSRTANSGNGLGFVCFVDTNNYLVICWREPLPSDFDIIGNNYNDNDVQLS